MGFENRLQKYVEICNHKKSNDHESMMTRWEALHFSPTYSLSITHHVCASKCGKVEHKVFKYNLVSMHQKLVVQIIIQVMKRFI